MKPKAVWRTVIFALIVLAIWFPRALRLDQFVTPDEPAWLSRSANFYYAMVKRDWSGTFQREHPGVTTMWAGAFTIFWQYRAFAWQASDKVLANWTELEPFLRAHGQDPLNLLEYARTLMVLANTLILLVAFFFAARVIGFLPAVLGFGLVALDPFHIGLTRLLHLDGLLSSLMLCSVLSLMSYFSSGRDRMALVISGMAAGLSWLTKSPALFLIAFTGLVTFVDILRLWRERDELRLRNLYQHTWPFLVWIGVGLAVFVVFWPATWTNFSGALSNVIGKGYSYATSGHDSAIFFGGRIYDGDPGWLYYPLTFLWRSTPIVLLGLGLAVIAFAARLGSFDHRGFRFSAAILTIYAVLFALMMSFGAKKFDRYILPSYIALDIVAGMGWFALAEQFWTSASSFLARLIAPGLIAVAFGFHLIPAIQTFPYYLSYYDPLMGGSAKAPQELMIGWGEGLDQAARYLNSKPGAERLRVMAHYSYGCFSYFFKGETVNFVDGWNETTRDQLKDVDYAVVYVHQWQRNGPDPEVLAYFASKTPEHIVWIDGIDYAQVYNMRTPSE
ncbi:MAG TPA: phospholipid carrier-dependent glycosyltransferase [Anaerolineales bacterium]|nr:phospholipid carrier-dependent glycosyltransferase [Anaerolineales bacterium]